MGKDPIFRKFLTGLVLMTNSFKKRDMVAKKRKTQSWDAILKVVQSFPEGLDLFPEVSCMYVRTSDRRFGCARHSLDDKHLGNL